MNRSKKACVAIVRKPAAVLGVDGKTADVQRGACYESASLVISVKKMMTLPIRNPFAVFLLFCWSCHQIYRQSQFPPAPPTQKLLFSTFWSETGVFGVKSSHDRIRMAKGWEKLEKKKKVFLCVCHGTEYSAGRKRSKCSKTAAIVLKTVVPVNQV